MKTEIWVSFNYYSYNLIFLKEFEFPFTPFLGLTILDTKDDFENNIQLNNTNYCHTNITYNVKKNCFVIDVINLWQYPISKETIDDTIRCFINTGWVRKDKTDIDSLKDLMNKKT